MGSIGAATVSIHYRVRGTARAANLVEHSAVAHNAHAIVHRGKVADTQPSLMGSTILPGKSEPHLAADAADERLNFDPKTEARLIADDWQGSVKSLISACVRIRRVILKGRGDQEYLKALLTALVDGRVLSRAEARLGMAAPKLSKLLKIGQSADLLRRSEIAQFLMPSYTTIYQLLVLSETLPDDHKEQKIQALISILTACPGEISREYLIEATRRLKRENVVAAVNGIRHPEHSPIEPKSRDLLEAGEQFDLLLLTPSKRDLRLLRADYSDGTLERCLPLFKLIQESAAAVIAAQIADFPLVGNVILPLCGFQRPSGVLLTRRPTSPDISEAEILITAERGGMRLVPPEDGLWLDKAGPADASAIATRLCPDASRKLHVFASAQADGWFCLSHSWAEMPSVR
jgi:hypothetical protein